MVLITKEEKEAISKSFPDAHIVRTMKQKSKRHRYYCEESSGVMRYLNDVRNAYGSSRQKDGGKVGNRKAR